MLYASTRSKVETYTAQRTLWMDCAPDGGQFIPLKLPQFKRTEILRLKTRTPEDNIAMILNKFFQTTFSGKEVEYAIGRSYYRITDIRHKMMLGELWHNTQGELDALIRLLIRRIAVEQHDGEPGQWPKIVVRIAMLFALYGDLLSRGTVNPLYPMDLAVPSGDFNWPMAAWYARKMGLPIDTIIICCNENDGARELIHRGQLRVDAPTVATITPKCDFGIPDGFERAIYTMLGREEAAEYLRIRKKGGFYAVNPEQQRVLNDGMYVAVNSSKRLCEVIPNACRTYGYILCPYSAMVYTGVMDYQSITGRYNQVLMLCDYSPLLSLETTSRAMGMDKTELRKRLHLD